MKRLNNENGFLTIIALLFVVLIIGILYYMNFNKMAGPKPDSGTQSMIKSAGIDNSNYKTILDSTRAQVKNIEKQQQERADAFVHPGDGSSY